MNHLFQLKRAAAIPVEVCGRVINSPLRAEVSERRPLAVFVGSDPREQAAVDVCIRSIAATCRVPVVVYPLVLAELQARSLYYRQTTKGPGGLMTDVIDGRPFSTEFSFSRFLTPFLASCARIHDFAIFMDCDMVVTRCFGELLKLIDRRAVVSCVPHEQRVVDGALKMDGQIQQAYGRKNWSSFMVFNVRHKGWRALTPRYVSEATGAQLHGFAWVDDALIGRLPVEWNWLVGSSTPSVIHYTEGGPWFPGYETVQWADIWTAYRDMANG